MKQLLLALLFPAITLSAWAQNDLTISDLATNKETKAAFKQMVGKQNLPDWVTKGGTTSQNQSVEIAGNKFLVLNACKPHNCAAQRMAVLYSPTAGKMSGVFSSSNEKDTVEKLTWLNITPDEMSIDGKTILFAALSGSLENHPDSFNYK